MLDIAKTFSKGINLCLKELIGKGVHAYVDDIVIYA